MKKSSITMVREITKAMEPTPDDYLMWVGSVHYPTVDTFIAEARLMGICKRLGKLPKRLIPGKSRVFLAHDDGIVGDGFIFGYFVPSWLEYLARNEQDIPYQIYDHVSWVQDWSGEKERECGYRHEGLYMVAVIEDDTQKGYFRFFKHPRILDEFDPGRKHFRGMLAIDYGDLVINATQEQIMVPPSRAIVKHKPISNMHLVQRMKRSGNMSREAMRIAYETGETKMSVMYRFLNLTGKIKHKEDDDE